MDENIDVNADNTKIHSNKTEEKASSWSPGTGPKESPGKRLYRRASVCLGLLCVLLLTALIVLSLYYKTSAEDTEVQLNGLKGERDQLKNYYHYCLAKQICPQGWVDFSSRCYYISCQQKNWFESQQDCKQRGADLAIINSGEEQEFINNLNKRIWIGLTDTDKEGSWNWVDGTNLTIRFWKQNEPNDAGGKEDCAESAVEFNPQMIWNDIPCELQRYWNIQNHNLCCTATNLQP
ncbi:lactose-binding lectin l-2-like [Scleropages formosus]|uniref:lactose-binding lectin l-2-like n=1 Tax=Scleropages formosus TaxID=113540 RepID=UPI0010FAAF82|nr:lactose-binding lectin l-2-like [Scleropages formosus]